MQSVNLINVSKSYKKRQEELRAVSDVSFEIQTNNIYGLLGLNGAGKTSIIKMITGLMLPDQGEISIFGVNAASSGAQSLIGAVLEGNRNLYWRMSVIENLTYFGVLKGLGIREAKKSALFLLEKFSFIEKKNVIVSELSRGMQQKLAIMISMVHSPRFLILDEPTLGLDVASVETLSDFIASVVKEDNLAVLLTSHDLGFVSGIASHFGILKSGQLIRSGEMTDLETMVDEPGYSVELLQPISEEQLVKLNELGTTVSEINPRTLIVPKADICHFFEVITPNLISKVNLNFESLETLLQR